jgi:hypothetical protein
LTVNATESTWDASKSIAVTGFTLQHLLYKMLSKAILAPSSRGWTRVDQ